MNKLINRVRQHKKAFTLIELVIVILIIAILAVVLIPQLSSMTNKAKTAGVQEDFHEFQIASQAVAYEQSGFGAVGTDNATVLALLNKNLDTENGIDNVTLGEGKSKNTDPWNKEYKVELFSALASDSDANSAGTAVSDVTDVVKAVRFTSGGPNGAIGTGNDDLTTTIYYNNAGSVVVTTNGFSLDKTN